MEPQFFVGIDIAAATFTAAVGTRPWKLLVPPTEFQNTPEGFHAFGQWLQEHRLNQQVALACMEATGVYGEALGYWLVSQGYRVAVEPPLKVKRAFETHGPKTDPVDARQIAEYACRFVDELSFWQPRPESLEQIRVLLATREQLTAQKAAHQNALHALRRKVVTTPLAERVHQQLILQCQEQIRLIEQELRRLMDQDPTFRRTLLLLLTVPGVGLLLAAQVVVLAYSSEKPLEARHLAGYAGIAPYEHESGKSVRRRTRSRQYGPAMLRKLLRLAARSVSTHKEPFRQYYLRKLGEGKLKQVAFNNVANKLLKIICAVLRSGIPYIPNYRSVNPLLLQRARQSHSNRNDIPPGPYFDRALASRNGRLKPPATKPRSRPPSAQGQSAEADLAPLLPQIEMKGDRLRDSWPASARCGRLKGQDLARSSAVGHARRTTPLGGHKEQRSLVRAPEHTGEASAIEVDRLYDLTTFAHSHAALVRNVAVPDGIVGVEADAIGGAAVEVGPHPPVRKAAVGSYVERSELVAVGLGDDKRRIIGRHRHAVRECKSVCHLPNSAIQGDESDHPGGELATRKVKVDAIDINVAPAVHDDLVPRMLRKARQIGMGDQRAVGLPAEEQSLAPRDDEQAPIAQPVDTKWDTRRAGDDLAPAFEIDGNDLLRAPVREHETVVVPTRRLAQRESGQQSS